MNRRNLLKGSLFAGGATFLGASFFSKMAHANISIPLDKVPEDLLESTLSNNHGHDISIPIADIIDGREKSYDITGASSHPHTIQLTKEHFKNLRLGNPTAVSSSAEAGHSHFLNAHFPQSLGFEKTISNNHGHAVILSDLEVQTDDLIILQIQGNSSHPHTIELNEDTLRELRLGNPVQVQSSNDAGHSHSVLISVLN